MRSIRSFFVFLWLVTLSLQTAHGNDKKPRFGMFFQMNRQGEKVSLDQASTVSPDDAPMERVCVDQTVLQAQVDHAKHRLLQKEHEAAQEQEKLNEQVQQLQEKLAEAERQLESKKLEGKDDTVKESDAIPSDNTDAPARLDAQRQELETKFAAELEETSRRLQELENELEESKGTILELQSELEQSEEKLIMLASSRDEAQQEWEREKQMLAESASKLEQGLQSARKEKSANENAFQKAKEDATYWEMAFQHRAYLNATHLIEFADVIVTAATAPVVETAHSLYQKHLKGRVELAVEATYSAYEKHVAPHYDKHLAPIYNEHMADAVRSGKESAHSTLNMLWEMALDVWFRGKEYLVNTTESLCKASLKSTLDERKRAKVQVLCDDAEPFVMSILSLPFVLIFGRLLIWALLLPIKLLLLISPVRFGELEMERDQPGTVSANGK